MLKETQSTLVGVRWVALLSLPLLLMMSVLYMPAVLAQDADALTAEEQKVLASLNAHRAEAGLVALVTDPLLSQAAQAHADDVLINRNFSHWGSDGTLAKDRVARTGYSANPWVSENWVSSSSPEGAMIWWMNDYIHRVNILTPRWREIGIGVAASANSGEMIFVTVFSPGRGSAGVGAPVVAASAAVAPAEVQPQSPPATPGQHVVQQGDTLLAIGLRFGHSMDDIANVNGMGQDDLLQIGQVLYMPGYGEDVVATTVGGIGGPVSVPTQAYEIAPGETLFSIAAKLGMTWQDLAAMNGMNEESLLQIGQKIHVPVAETEESNADTATESGDNTGTAAQDDVPGESDIDAISTPDVDSVLESDPDPVTQYHVIGDGDTVIFIARRYGIAWGALLELNGLDEDTILQPGKILRLR